VNVQYRKKTTPLALKLKSATHHQSVSPEIRANGLQNRISPIKARMRLSTTMSISHATKRSLQSASLGEGAAGAAVSAGAARASLVGTAEPHFGQKAAPCGSSVPHLRQYGKAVNLNFTLSAFGYIFFFSA
jgi:hypothetical protein